MASEQSAIGQLTNQLNKPYDLQSAINNPYTTQLYQTQMGPIAYNAQQEQSQLTNDLNAKNLNGGSYAALKGNQLTQDYNLASQGAENQALTGGMNAYNQQIANQLNALGGIQNAYNSQYSAATGPFTQGTQYQSSLAPIYGAQANIYGTQMQAQNALMQGLMGGGGPSIGVGPFSFGV